MTQWFGAMCEVCGTISARSFGYWKEQITCDLDGYVERDGEDNGLAILAWKELPENSRSNYGVVTLFIIILRWKENLKFYCFFCFQAIEFGSWETL